MLEDAFWDIYKEECEDECKKPSEIEYDNLPTQWFESHFYEMVS